MRHQALLLSILAPLTFAQPTRPTFEVASIRPHEGLLPRIGDFSISGPRVTYGTYNLMLLIMEAYNVKGYQVSASSSAKLLTSDYYEIAAVAPGSTVTRDQTRLMLQSLLTHRFHLQFHREPRQISVYELVVDKNGPNLKASSGDNPCAVHIGPVQPSDHKYRYQFTNCPINRLVNLESDRPILDKTFISGPYDITLFATPDFILHDSAEPGDISVRDAVRELGLRLDPQKAQIEVLVVDHVERPSEN